MIRRFPGFYASGWLLKLQAELERDAKVGNFILKSKWNVLDLSKFHPPIIVKFQICLKCSGNREQLGFNISSPLFPCCHPSWGILAKVLKLISTQYFTTFILKIVLPCEDWRAFQHCLWPRLGPRLPQVTTLEFLRLQNYTFVRKWSPICATYRTTGVAEAMSDDLRTLQETIVTNSTNFFGNISLPNIWINIVTRSFVFQSPGGDKNCPLTYEPSGTDFLSPCIQVQ